MIRINKDDPTNELLMIVDQQPGITFLQILNTLSPLYKPSQFKKTYLSKKAEPPVIIVTRETIRKILHSDNPRLFDFEIEKWDDNPKPAEHYFLTALGEMRIDDAKAGE